MRTFGRGARSSLVFALISAAFAVLGAVLFGLLVVSVLSVVLVVFVLFAMIVIRFRCAVSTSRARSRSARIRRDHSARSPDWRLLLTCGAASEAGWLVGAYIVCARPRAGGREPAPALPSLRPTS